jgi:DNA-binding IclR family transcriptional regulator
MKRSVSFSQAQDAAAGASPASQTLVRGLDVLEMVATGPLALPALANRLGLARSTAHRLATALLERRYLTLVPRQGYGLGPKLLELGSCAQDQTVLVRVARPYMESLSAESLDTAHISICDAGGALLLERIPGQRRLLPALRVGERMKLSQGASGWALLLDAPEASWRETFAQDCGTAASSAAFVDRMRGFAGLGYAFDPGDENDNVCTVAAPVRGAEGNIVAAIGLSTASQYIDETRLATVGAAVARAAAAISGDLGRPRAGFDTANASVHGGQHAKSLNHGSTRKNGGFGAPDGAKPLEAGAQSMHDPNAKNSFSARTPDGAETSGASKTRCG